MAARTAPRPAGPPRSIPPTSATTPPSSSSRSGQSNLGRVISERPQVLAMGAAVVVGLVVLLRGKSSSGSAAPVLTSSYPGNDQWAALQNAVNSRLDALGTNTTDAMQTLDGNATGRRKRRTDPGDEPQSTKPRLGRGVPLDGPYRQPVLVGDSADGTITGIGGGGSTMPPATTSPVNPDMPGQQYVVPTILTASPTRTVTTGPVINLPAPDIAANTGSNGGRDAGVAAYGPGGYFGNAGTYAAGSVAAAAAQNGYSDAVIRSGGLERAMVDVGGTPTPTNQFLANIYNAGASQGVAASPEWLATWMAINNGQ